MFTFGIFTTHLPYVAFVVFYAYFLLFGVNKASSGEIENGEKFCKTEWIAQKHFNKEDVKVFHYSDFSCDEIQNQRHSVFETKPGIIRPEFLSLIFSSEKYFFCGTSTKKHSKFINKFCFWCQDFIFFGHKPSHSESSTTRSYTNFMNRIWI